MVSCSKYSLTLAESNLSSGKYVFTAYISPEGKIWIPPFSISSLYHHQCPHRDDETIRKNLWSEIGRSCNPVFGIWTKTGSNLWHLICFETDSFMKLIFLAKPFSVTLQQYSLSHQGQEMLRINPPKQVTSNPPHMIRDGEAENILILGIGDVGMHLGHMCIRNGVRQIFDWSRKQLKPWMPGS